MIDRRLLGEDEFFEPRDLGFVAQPAAPAAAAPAAAPAAIPGRVVDLMQYGVGSPGTESAYQTDFGNVQDYFNLAPLGDLSKFAQTQYQGEGEYTTRYNLPELQGYFSQQGMELREANLPGNKVARWVQGPQGVVEGTYQEVDYTDRDFGLGTALLTAAAGNIAPLGFGVLNTASALQQGNIGAAALNLAKLAGVPGVGDITKQVSETLRSVIPDEILGSTRIADLASGVVDDITKQTAAAAVSGKKIDLGSAVTNSLLNQGLGGIAREIGVDPKTLTAGLKLAAGQGGVSNIYNIVSGGIGKLSDISKENLAPQQEVDRLLARYPAPSEDALAGPSELSKSTLASDILSGTVAPDTDIRTLADTILGKGNEVTLSPLPLEFVQPSGPSVSLPDDFISSLAPEVAETFPVESRDVRSADQRIETIGRREEDLDVPLDIYLPELFGGQPRAGELQGPSTIETIGKRPTEPVTPIPSFLVEDILRDGVPDEKTPSQIADEILGEQQKIEVIGKRPGDSITPIPSFLDDVQIRQEPLPDTKTPAQLAEEILPPPPPVSPSAPRPAPAPAPTPAKPDDLDLSALFALLGAIRQKPEAAEPYQLANVAPGVEAGLRAIEQMYGIRRG